jgi:uncharacterized protein
VSDRGDTLFYSQGASLSATLDKLYRLQDRIRFVADRRRERETVPEELTEVDREYREKVDTVARLKQRLVAADVEKRRAEAELTDVREKHKKYQTQLRQVQTSREYGALLNEIDGVDKLIRSTEDRVLALEEEIDTARADLDAREEKLPAETEEHETRIKDWRAAQKVIDSDLDAAAAEIRQIESEIPARDRAEFLRLIDKKGGLAIAKVVNNSCSACHVKVRPAALQILKNGHEIVYCDSCKRILYWDTQAS